MSPNLAQYIFKISEGQQIVQWVKALANKFKSLNSVFRWMWWNERIIPTHMPFYMHVRMHATQYRINIIISKKCKKHIFANASFSIPIILCLLCSNNLNVQFPASLITILVLLWRESHKFWDHATTNPGMNHRLLIGCKGRQTLRFSSS